MTDRINYVAAAPEGVKALGTLHAYIAKSELDPVLVDLVYLRVSQINGCAYCIDVHSRDLLAKGVATAKLMLVPVWREGGALFSDAERAALAWAERVTAIADRGIPEQVYAEAEAAFSPRTLADLTLAIGLINAYNRLAISFAIVPPSRAVLAKEAHAAG